MELSNFTALLLQNKLISPSELAQPWMLITFGSIMFVASILGIIVNLQVLYSYTHQKMSSFLIMCSSKTISNVLIIIGYLFYNAPITIFHIFNGPTFLNMLVNQSVTYGIYLLGPGVQLLLSINRLLVMFFVKQSSTQNNQKITLTSLGVFWIVSLTITGLGTGDACNIVYVPDLLNWWSNGCDDVMAKGVTSFVLFCGAFSIVCNLFVVFKLISSTNTGVMDAESSRIRRQKSRNLFIQNCIQDCLFVTDTLNSFFFAEMYENVLFRFTFNLFSNLMTHVIDGCIMLIFTYENKAERLKVLAVKRGCMAFYYVETITWYEWGACVQPDADLQLEGIAVLAIVSNVFNVIIAAKILILTKSNKLVSEVVKVRNRKNRRLFVQNCFQDWIYVLDTVNSSFVHWFDVRTFTGPSTLNFVSNQMAAYSIYLLGPLTQMLITFNRFLAVFCPFSSHKWHEKCATLIGLGGCWTIGVYATVSPVIRECVTFYYVEMMTWYEWDPCVQPDADVQLQGITVLAVVSNFFNLIIIVKMLILKKSNRVVSETAKMRNRKNRRFFVQNCIQDWIYVLDTVNSGYAPSPDMSLSNETLEQIWIEDTRPDDVAEPWMTISAGIFMIATSTFGIFINMLVLSRFVAKNMPSFYIMCSSKTVSNSIVLFSYLKNCTNIYNFDILTWDNLDPCVDVLAQLVMYWIGVLAVISNTFNLVVAIKLVVSATKQHLDSVATKRRRRTSRRLFLQSCFQDWIYLIDTLNSMYVYAWSSDIVWQFVFTIFSNLFVHVADGCIMLFFNYEKKPKALLVPLALRKHEVTINVTF
ncbi:unnamed protein product [Caenorhabditis sp. 36 PRJEB53466]|nr:unnamed protein product [Caenorhabditis sp. 36 PRJEB53466]